MSDSALSRRHVGTVLVLLSALPLLCGCAESVGPDTLPATGTITFDGQPVAGATVLFTPASDSSEMQKAAQAETDDQGNYEIQTYVGETYKPGIVPGEYVVTVEKLELPKDMRGSPKHLLPKKYRSTSATPLKASVTAESTGPYEFDLE